SARDKPNQAHRITHRQRIDDDNRLRDRGGEDGLFLLHQQRQEVSHRAASVRWAVSRRNKASRSTGAGSMASRPKPLPTTAVASASPTLRSASTTYVVAEIAGSPSASTAVTPGTRARQVRTCWSSPR